MTVPMVLSGAAFAAFVVVLGVRAVVGEVGATAPYPSVGRLRAIRVLDVVTVVLGAGLLAALLVLVVTSLT